MSRSATAILGLVFPTAVGVIIFAFAGRWDLPFVWAILGLMAAFYLALAAFADAGMMRERLAPGPGNQDRLTRFLGVGMLVGHWVLAGLDVGRFQWSLVPWQVQVAGVVGYAAALGVLFWAMHANPFYSSVVRVQAERGHHTVTAGPCGLAGAWQGTMRRRPKPHQPPATQLVRRRANSSQPRRAPGN